MQNFTALRDLIAAKMDPSVTCDYDYQFSADILTIKFSNSTAPLVWENASGRMDQIVDDVRTELLPHYATAIDAAEAERAERGDRFATAAEMQTLRDSADCLRDVLEGMHNVNFVVDEYAQQEKAEADAQAAELAEANRNAAIPDGFVEVISGPVLEGYYVWNKSFGGFDQFNYDAPSILAEQCFLVCRPVAVAAPIEDADDVCPLCLFENHTHRNACPNRYHRI